jgi:hypothetical protein
MLNVFYRIAFRKKIYATIGELKKDLDAWMTDYNEVRPHQGRYCFGKTPKQQGLSSRAASQYRRTSRGRLCRSTHEDRGARQGTQRARGGGV